MTAGVDLDATGLGAVGTLRGVRSGLLRTREIVHRVGRMTGITPRPG
ncbi:MAG TPA: hypothetical protein VEW48_11620 [Thermoanaerobaculia bacterium]|nr:hypothetical protein [Thermoanaerobaculia bacterium]